jgi:hypothetical protein
MKEPRELPSQRKLQDLFNYDPFTGDLIRNHSIANNSTNAGDIAGRITHLGYRVVKIENVAWQAHRLIWKHVHGEDPLIIDHINHDRADNRIHNLRSVTHKENQKNRAIHSDNKSGVTGVSWCKVMEKWRATIYTQEKCKHLGHFDSIDDAGEARKRAEIKYGFHKNHGED